MKIVSLILLLLCVSVAAKGSPEQEEIEIESRNYSCDTETLKGITFSYCLRNQEATNNDDIVYFFHGLNGSEKTWFRQIFGTWIIQKWWYLKGYKPRVVGVSFGRQWLLVNNKKFPLLPFFTKEIMPYLEKRMGGLRKGRRHIIGQSMGGYNGAVIALKNPGMFSRVALLCPAITTVGPYADAQDIDNYVYRTHASPRLVRKMLNISRSVFVNQQDWVNHDPIHLLKNYHSPKKSKFYLSIGMFDGYGFQEGAETFYRLANKNAFLSRWVPVPGGHCSFSRRATAYFIMGE